jgi:undecaprenyl-diphosphatase
MISMPLLFNAPFVFDIIKLALYIAFGYLALKAYALHGQSGWASLFKAKRFAVLALLTLLVVGIKIFEDVIAKESGPVDMAALWFIRQHMPRGVEGFFQRVTLSGSGAFLTPITLLATAVFFICKKRRQAVLVASSMACASLLTYGLKALVDRSRPELWSTTWYWGSSFPSGHTLNTAAFATALALSVAQIWPASRYVNLGLATLWIFLVGMSRLVLGVHWPTDVLAAICLGVFIPLLISMMLDFHQHRPAHS